MTSYYNLKADAHRLSLSIIDNMIIKKQPLEMDKIEDLFTEKGLPFLVFKKKIKMAERLGHVKIDGNNIYPTNFKRK